MKQNEIIVTYGDLVKEMVFDVLSRAKIEELIPKNTTVGLKPNLVVARPASSGATTSTEVVAAVIEYLRGHGINDIIILEGSWVGDSTERAFNVCGYKDISSKYSVPLFDTKKDSSTRLSHNGLDINICDTALKKAGFLINLPVLKGHCQTAITCALKNMKGVIPDSEKRRFHSLGLHKPIAYLNKLRKADFVLVDGLNGDLDFEEGGNPVQMNRIIGALDSVLVDSYVASLMGYEPEDIGYIKIAAEIGVGSSDLARAEIIELNRDTTMAKPTSSRKVAALAGYVNENMACSACYGNLIYAIARLDEEGRLSRSQKFSIGQGFKGKAENGIGIGNCCSGFEKCVKGCPPKALDIIKALA